MCGGGRAPHMWMSGHLLGVGPFPPVWVLSIELGSGFRGKCVYQLSHFVGPYQLF